MEDSTIKAKQQAIKGILDLCNEVDRAQLLAFISGEDQFINEGLVKKFPVLSDMLGVEDATLLSPILRSKK